MPSIFPDLAAGGLIVRDVAGVCYAPPAVANAYCPPLPFQTTCDIRYLPSDCTARITPSQINGIVSELVSLAVCLNPEGTWNCNALTNLCSAFTAWADTTGIVDGITIIGTGVLGDEWRVSPDGVVGAICADDSAADALADCLISADANNSLTQGVDGRLWVSPIAMAQAICTVDAAGDFLANCLMSTDLGNPLALGADGRLTVNSTEMATAICASNAAGDTLAACLISTDFANAVILGADGRLYVTSGDAFPGDIFGYKFTNNGADTTNDFDIGAGVAISDAAPYVKITLGGGGMTKRTDAAWSVGHNGGCWLDGAAMPNGSGHVFAIMTPLGVVDIGASASLSPVLPLGYTKKRRIFSILRESGALPVILQQGDIFRRRAEVAIINGVIPYTSILSNMRVPSGLNLQPIFRVNANAAAGAACFVSVNSGDEAGATIAVLNAGSGGQMHLYQPIPPVFTTNVFGQLWTAMAGSGTIGTFEITAHGWVDTRGRNI